MRLSGRTIAIVAILVPLIVFLGIIGFLGQRSKANGRVIGIITAEEKQQNAGIIEEPSWDPESLNEIGPGSEIAKDPQLISNVKWDAWAFFRVEVPTIKGQFFGNKTKVYDAFEFMLDDNSKWKLIETVKNGDSETAGENSVYLYAYVNPIKENESTSPLFTKITVPNFINDIEITKNIDLTGFLVNAENFDTYLEASKEIGGTGKEISPSMSEELSQVYYQNFENNEEIDEFWIGTTYSVFNDNHTIEISEDDYLGDELFDEALDGSGIETIGVHYVFDAENPNNKLGDKIKNISPENPLKIYFKCTPHTVTYKYDESAPSNAPELPEVLNTCYSASVNVEPDPVMDGYTFEGWIPQSTGDLNMVDGTFIMPNNDVVFTGSWVKAN